ncbi:transcription initiation factor IID, 18kD subunit-domain-containing protein [Pisolithus albus]|nr:transcription initiation factor IID, 18kD subunit-domain-containing protein [Pisolithus albus]
MDYYKRPEQAPPPIQTAVATNAGAPLAVPAPSTPAPSSAASLGNPPLPHTASSTGPTNAAAPNVPAATPTSTTTALPALTGAQPVVKKSDGQRDYKYTQEISQMMFVFGEIQDPNHETVNLVEDIVRSQLIELILQARALANRRNAKFITAEDLIFLIRHDRGKVNRLRTYLSWKDVRKHAKDSGGDGGGGMEVEALEDGDDKLAAKAQKITIKLPWEISTIYSEVLRQAGHQSDDEEDEDDIEAHEASIQRLKEADDATRQMTREEYQHYSDCRQASFTYRKAKRFRDFLNLPPHLDLRPNDDTIDIVGFLAFEMVRSLTLAGLEVKKSLEESYLRDDYAPSSSSPLLGKRKANAQSEAAKRARRERIDGEEDDDDDTPLPASSLFLPPPEARTALRPEHIQDAFARMQADTSHHRSAGMRNWRGGLVRTRVSLI